MTIINKIMTILAALSLFLVLYFIQTETNTNASSRFATIESLVTQHSFIIDSTIKNWKTIDVAKFEGHFYSPKPPVLSALLAVYYGLISRLTGITFQNRPAMAIYLVNMMAGFLPYFLLLQYFYRLLRLWTISPLARVGSFSCLSIGYIGLGYATGLNNHTPTAAALMMSLYYAYLIRHQLSQSLWHWIFVGFLSSAVATFDHPCGIFSLALFAYLFDVNKKKTLLFYVAGALPLLILNGLINYSMTKTILPLQIFWDAFKFPGSYWLHTAGYDALWEPKLIYAFNLLLGHHGFFSITPALLLGVYSMGKCFLNRTRHAPEAMLMGVTFLVMMGFYILRTKNYGGNCIGVRWMIPVMPPIFLFVSDWLKERYSKMRALVFIFFLLVGFLNAMDSLKSPWPYQSAWDRLYHRVQNAILKKIS